MGIVFGPVVASSLLRFALGPENGVVVVAGPVILGLVCVGGSAGLFVWVSECGYLCQCDRGAKASQEAIVWW